MNDLYLDNAIKLLNTARRDLEPEPGARGYVFGFADRKSIDEQKRTVRAVVSSEDVDRYGEVVLMSAYTRNGRIERFLQDNPVLINDHDYRTENVLGQWIDMRVEGSELVGTAQFRTTPKAQEVFEGYISGDLRAFSVGFLAHGHEMREMERDGKRRRIRHFTDVELLEVSAVAIPANPQALVRAASAMGKGGDGDDSAAAKAIKELEGGIQKLLGDARQHYEDGYASGFAAGLELGASPAQRQESATDVGDAADAGLDQELRSLSDRL